MHTDRIAREGRAPAGRSFGRHITLHGHLTPIRGALVRGSPRPNLATGVVEILMPARARRRRSERRHRRLPPNLCQSRNDRGAEPPPGTGDGLWVCSRRRVGRRPPMRISELFRQAPSLLCAGTATSQSPSRAAMCAYSDSSLGRYPRRPSTRNASIAIPRKSLPRSNAHGQQARPPRLSEF